MVIIYNFSTYTNEIGFLIVRACIIFSRTFWLTYNCALYTWQ